MLGTSCIEQRCASNECIDSRQNSRVVHVQGGTPFQGGEPLHVVLAKFESVVVEKLDTLYLKLQGLQADVGVLGDSQRKVEVANGQVTSLPAGQLPTSTAFISAIPNGEAMEERADTARSEKTRDSGESRERKRAYLKDWAKNAGGTATDLSQLEGWNICRDEHGASGFADAASKSHESLNMPDVTQIDSVFLRLVNDSRFDYLFAVLIVLNSAILGCQVQIMAVHELSEPPPITDRVQMCFTLVFLVELLIRMAAWRWNFFNADPTWNTFDSVIVSISVFELTVETFAGSVDGASNLSALRVLRILRIVRIVRIIRVFRFFTELRTMVYSILGSGQPLFWAMMLLAVTLYIVAIFFTQAVTDYRTESDPNDKLAKDLEKYFASLFETMYYLFQAMCGGIGWSDITIPLMQLHWAYAFMMLFFTCFTLLALLNIITGVFVESAIEKARGDKESVIQQELEEQTSKTEALEEAFHEIDTDASGFLELAEFEKLMDDPRIVAYFRTMGLHISTAYHLFRLLDMDNSNTVSISEFVLGCLRLQGSAKNVDVATLMYENKRMMMKWVTFMDFVEEKFDEIIAQINASRPAASVGMAGTSEDMHKLSRAGSTLSNGSVVGRRRSWREKSLGQKSSLNLYDTNDPCCSQIIG